MGVYSINGFSYQYSLTIVALFLVATLGIVEFFIFVLHKYWESMNVPKEKVFANVHFTLFYTAVLNAVQSVILAIVTMRRSQRIWVETEALELNHYVEIREEFQRVTTKLQALKAKGDSKPKKDTSSTSSIDNPKKEIDNAGVETSVSESVFVFEFNMNGVRSLFVRIVDHIRYPRLKRKHDKLLLQVRFHELRVHFLQAYKLPLRLRVSDYLIRSENQVLIKLVQVSTLAWLLLTAAMNLLYVCLGLVAYETEDSEIVGTTMIWIFFWCLVVFLLASVLVYNKMKSIFKTIMHTKTLWDIQNDDEIKEQLADEQLALFWGGDPKYVIAAIQFMQFGFAMALSVVLIFYEIINDGDFPMVTFLLAIFFCYALFVYVTAQVIPQYTLCTSLGQLVNQKRLNETLALFHLEEAKRLRLKQIELEGYNIVDEMDLGLSNRAFAPAPEARLPAIEGFTKKVKAVPSLVTKGVKTFKRGFPSKDEDASQDPATLMAQLVKLDTDSLRTNLPRSEREELARRESERETRKSNRKSLSDGVSAMANMSFRTKRTVDDSVVPIHASMISPRDIHAERSGRRGRRKKSASDGVAAMAWTHSKRFDERDLIPASVPEEEKAEEPEENVEEPPDVSLIVSDPISNDAPSDEATTVVSLEPIEDTNELYDSTDSHSDSDDNLEAGSFSDDKPLIVAAPPPPPSLTERFRAFCLSKRFPVISRIFGTMIAFFCVGQRIERFLHTEGIVSEDFISFDFHNSASFWALSTWMLAFLGMSGLTLIVFHPWNSVQNQRREQAVVAAAVLDIVLTLTCFTVFMVAETQRCCDPNGESSSVGDASQHNVEDGYSYPVPCSCPAFGSRLYGGLGTLEPYVTLIGLRVFRHWAADCLVGCLRNSSNDGANGMAAKKRFRSKHHMSMRTDPFDVFGDSHRGATAAAGTTAHHNMQANVGTISELWQTAVGQYPDIVATHGEFSGELLQAMLGLYVAAAERPLCKVGNGGASALVTVKDLLVST